MRIPLYAVLARNRFSSGRSAATGNKLTVGITERQRHAYILRLRLVGYVQLRQNYVVILSALYHKVLLHVAVV